jgi:Tat protein secretion system quality control protein TatD with DNase activity
VIILSHRGFWQSLEERNERIAFERSFNAGFGTETDLRDIAGKIVISHDMPKGDEMTFEELLQIMDGHNLPLALNIKADGQADAILELLKKYNHTNYFTFDMSIPDMICHMRVGVRVFTGLSDVLPAPVLLDKAAGVWLDSFNGDWYDADVIDELIAKGKQVCIVSSDLHKRNTSKQWEVVKQTKSLQSNDLLICTDKPIEAKEYFYGKN